MKKTKLDTILFKVHRKFFLCLSPAPFLVLVFTAVLNLRSCFLSSYSFFGIHLVNVLRKAICKTLVQVEGQPEVARIQLFEPLGGSILEKAFFCSQLLLPTSKLSFFWFSFFWKLCWESFENNLEKNAITAHRCDSWSKINSFGYELTVTELVEQCPVRLGSPWGEGNPSRWPLNWGLWKAFIWLPGFDRLSLPASCGNCAGNSLLLIGWS